MVFEASSHFVDEALKLEQLILIDGLFGEEVMSIINAESVFDSDPNSGPEATIMIQSSADSELIAILLIRPVMKRYCMILIVFASAFGYMNLTIFQTASPTLLVVGERFELSTSGL